jgi:hypothetical protein
MSQSLGFRRGCDHNADRPGERPRPAPVSIPEPIVTAPARRWAKCGVFVPRGFVTMLLFASLFATTPLLYAFVDIDYTDRFVRGGVIATSTVLATAVLMGDSAAWFNYALFFHIGVEVQVMKVLMDFANDTATSDAHTVLAWVTDAVILLHLIPFLLTHNVRFLAVLAYVGVVANTSALVFLDSSLLLLVGSSSLALLGAMLCICGVCEIQASLLARAQIAMHDGTWFSCARM